MAENDPLLYELDQLFGRNTLEGSFAATLLMVFAGLSLLLAAVGLFGVLSYMAAQHNSRTCPSKGIPTASRIDPIQALRTE